MKTINTYNKEKIDKKTTYSNATPTPSAVGGIKAGTTFNNTEVVDIINDLLYPFVPPTINFSVEPSGGVFENGTSVKIGTITYSIAKNSASALKELVGYVGSETFTIATDFDDTPSGTKAVDYTISTDKGVHLRLVYLDGTTQKNLSSSSVMYQFVDPFFNGVSASATADVKTLTKEIRRKGNQTLTFALNQEYLYYAYPKSYGTLKSIKDQSGFENINGFTLTTEKLTVASGSVDYYVYRLTDKATASAMTLTFVF